MVVKTPAQRCLASVTKKVHKNDMKAALDGLQAGMRRGDANGHIVLSMIKAPSDTPGSGSQPACGEPEMYSASYKQIRKFPKTDMQKLLLTRSPGKQFLSEATLLLWKMRHPDIVHHLFQFDYHISLGIQWCPGDAHRKDIFPQILEAWQLQQGGSAIAKRGQLIGDAGPHGPDWSKHGVFAYGPADADEKTHVIHTPTGKSTPLPASLAADNTWVFNKNWSVLEAEVCDDTGELVRPVMSFWKDKPGDINGTGFEEFAYRQAKLLCKDSWTAEQEATSVMGAVFDEKEFFDNIGDAPTPPPSRFARVAAGFFNQETPPEPKRQRPTDAP